MSVAVLLIAMAAAHGPFEGRLPARAQVRDAYSASRACSGDPACQPVTIETRNEICYRIPVQRVSEDLPRVAAARCRFQYRDSITGAHGPVQPTRWTRTRADFFLMGTPCGGEGQEADLMCYSWFTERPAAEPGAEAR